MQSRTFVFSLALAAPALAQAPLYDLSGTTGDELGHSIASIGDVDGDGHDDFAIGAPFGNGLQPDAGYVNIYSSSNGYAIRTLQGEHTGDHYGWSVSGLGDINGDGVGDLAVGAPFYDSGLGQNTGRVYLVSGATGANIWQFGGVNTDSWLGWAVCGLADVNGDGVGDIALGEPGMDLGPSDSIGRVSVISGAGFFGLGSVLGEDDGDYFGYSIADAGDTDGDGKHEFVVGAPYYDTGFTQPAGRAYLVELNPMTRTLLATGSSTGGHLGHAVAAGADFDGDGAGDIVLGEPYRAVAGLPQGRVWVLSGQANHAILKIFVGTSDDELGYSVAALRDADGDGRGDLAIGAPQADIGAGIDFGLANVYSGATWSLIYQAGGYVTDDRMGTAVASAGLLNADPWTDVLCAASWSSLHGAYCGRVRSILGNAPYPIGYCTAKTNSAGCTPYVSFTGCTSASISNYFHVIARNVLPNVVGNLIWSLSPNSAPFHGGTLCVAAPIHRTPMQLASSLGSGPCDGQYDFPMDHAYIASNGLTAGMDFYAQYWSRDTGFAAPNNIGLTNGLKITVLP